MGSCFLNRAVARTDKAAHIQVTGNAPAQAEKILLREKLENIFSENSAMLRGYIAGFLYEQADIDDVLQEVFIRLLKAEDISHWEKSPKPYLCRVALNYIRDNHRRGKARKRECHMSLEDYDCSATDITPEVILHWQQQLDNLTQAIEELRPKCKKIFLMHRNESKTYKEIGVELGMSHKTVENYMDEALKHCKARVSIGA